MQPRTTLTQQEEHLFKVLSSERFLKMEGLGNEVAHFIYDYDPTWALDVAQAKKRIKTRLDTGLGIKIFEINLYDLCVDLLKERNVWDRVLAAEPTMDKPDFLKMLQNMLDPQMHLAPAIKSRIEARPITWPSSFTTGRWRKCPSTISAIASASSVCGDAVSTWRVMRSDTGTVGSMPSLTHRSRSRSVITPTRSSPSASTIAAPTSCSTMRRAASPTRVSGVTATSKVLMTSVSCMVRVYLPGRVRPAAARETATAA